MPRLDRRHFLAAAGSLGLVGAARAQATWPNRPVRVVVPFAPGGFTDIVARLVTTQMGEGLGQAFVVENRAGGGGTIGSDAVAKAAPDGATLLVGTGSTHSIAPALMATPPYRPLEDFTPIATLVRVPLVAVVHPSVPARTLAELRDLARARPGALNYGSPGPGTVGHLVGVLFDRVAEVRTEHVAYRGSGPAVQDLVAGNIQILFDSPPAVLGHVRSGALRALAITGEERLASMPDVPTAAEAGLPGFHAASWAVLMGPAGLPRPIVEAANRAANAALRNPTVAQRLTESSAVAVGGTPEEAAAYLAAEWNRWAPIARGSGATLQ